MILAALGSRSRMPLANPRLMSQVTRRTRSGSPLWSMKSRANRLIVVESLPDDADYVALHQVSDDGDVPVALPAGLVDAYGLHARVVLESLASST